MWQILCTDLPDQSNRRQTQWEMPVVFCSISDSRGWWDDCLDCYENCRLRSSVPKKRQEIDCWGHGISFIPIPTFLYVILIKIVFYDWCLCPWASVCQPQHLSGLESFITQGSFCAQGTPLQNILCSVYFFSWIFWNTKLLRADCSVLTRICKLFWGFCFPPE